MNNNDSKKFLLHLNAKKRRAGVKRNGGAQVRKPKLLISRTLSSQSQRKRRSCVQYSLSSSWSSLNKYFSGIIKCIMSCREREWKMYANKLYGVKRARLKESKRQNGLSRREGPPETLLRRQPRWKPRGEWKCSQSSPFNISIFSIFCSGTTESDR